MKNVLAALAIVLGALSPVGAQGVMPSTSIPTPSDPNAIPLYAGAAPGSETATQSEVWETMPGPNARIVRNVTRPTLTPYLPTPDKASGAAMIVAPGGAFVLLSMDFEGYQVAQWLADHGIAAFVLKYRLNKSAVDPQQFSKDLDARMRRVAGPNAPRPETPAEALADAKAAMTLVRRRAAEWGIDPARVGFMGFSAGAMTTLSVGVATDPAVRPNFIAPIYPPMAAQEVPADAPPMFVAIAADDPLFGGGHVDLVKSWLAAKRPVELHMFERGGHGFGMKTQQLTSDHWIQQLLWWLQARGYLTASR